MYQDKSDFKRSSDATNNTELLIELIDASEVKIAYSNDISHILEKYNLNWKTMGSIRARLRNARARHLFLIEMVVFIICDELGSKMVISSSGEDSERKEIFAHFAAQYLQLLFCRQHYDMNETDENASVNASYTFIKNFWTDMKTNITSKFGEGLSYIVLFLYYTYERNRVRIMIYRNWFYYTNINS